MGPEYTATMEGRMLTQREDELFHELKTRYNNLVPDGAPNPAEYEANNPKLLFLLKEVDDEGEGGWDLRDTLRDGQYGQTWNNVVRWTMGFRKLPVIEPWLNLPCVDQKERQKWLQQVVVMNVKKYGGGPTAHDDAIRSFVAREAVSLREQLSLYRPHITVCCGTVPYLRQIYNEDQLDWKESTNGTQYCRTGELGLVLDFYHPQAHFPGNMMYLTLMHAAAEVFQAEK